MTTNFALKLSFDGIDLLHRVQRGWRLVGQVDVEDPNLAEALADLRDKAAAIEPDGLRTKIVIPLDQIKYLAIDGTRTEIADIHAALDGTTPYSLDDLVIDFERSGGRTHIAAVARETLQQAEEFARAPGFNPVCFVAVPEPFTFQSEVFFGPTTMMPEVLGPDGTVARDALPVLVVGTRIKSRLLVFNVDDAEAGDDDFDPTATKPGDLPTPEPGARPAPAHVSNHAIGVIDAVGKLDPDDDTPKNTDADMPPDPVAAIDDLFADRPPAPFLAEDPIPAPIDTPLPPVTIPARIDPIIAEYHAPAAALPLPEPTPEVIAAQRPATLVSDLVIAEYYPPEAPAPAPAQPAPPIRLSAVGIDQIIPEYHADLVQAAPPLHLVPPRDKAPLAADKKPLPTAAPRRGRFAVGAAIAASLVVVAGLIWSQRSDAPMDAPLQTTVATPDPALPAPTAPAIAALPDTPTVPLPLQEIVALMPPQLPAFSVATPGLFAGPVRSTPQLMETAFAPDVGLADVDGPPEPPVPDVAGASVGTPILRGRVLTPDEAARVYAATGVWQRASRFVSVPRVTTSDGIAVPPPLPTPAPIAQPAAVNADDRTDLSFIAPANPPPAGVTFPIDENGFILATPEGTVTPEGAIVIAGLPDIQVRARPTLTEEDLARMAALAPAPEGVVIVPGAPAIQPPLRPEDLVPPETTAGGVALTALQPDANTADAGPVLAADPALASIRPRLRPASLAAAQNPADLPSNPDITSVIAGLDTDAPAPFIDMTASAIGVSQRPEARPRNFDRVVAIARSRQQTAPAPTETASNNRPNVEVTLPQSTAPVPGGVARAATQDGAIALREMNLIGVYGRPNARRALVRLSNGRYVRVEVGSALDGGQVTAIGDSALNYVKRGRTYALELPKG